MKRKLVKDVDGAEIVVGVFSLILLFIFFIILLGVIMLVWGLLNFIGALLIFFSIIVLWKSKFKFNNPLFLILFCLGLVLIVGSSFLGLEVLPDFIDFSGLQGVL